MLTARKSDIEAKMMNIANKKLALSRRASEVSRDYSAALNRKNIFWNTGNENVQLSYDLIMRPNTLNNLGQYIITNAVSDRVILDHAYINKLGLKDSGNPGDLAKTLSIEEFLQKIMNLERLRGSDFENFEEELFKPRTGTSGGTETAAATASSANESAVVSNSTSAQASTAASNVLTGISWGNTATNNSWENLWINIINVINSIMTGGTNNSDNTTVNDNTYVEEPVSTETSDSASKEYGPDSLEYYVSNYSTSGLDLNDICFYLNLYNAINTFGWEKINFAPNSDNMQNMLANNGINIRQLQNDENWNIISVDSINSPLNTKTDENEITREEAKYRAESDRISTQEKSWDLQMNMCKTEHSATQTEIESIENILKKKFEGFKLFDA